MRDGQAGYLYHEWPGKAPGHALHTQGKGPPKMALKATQCAALPPHSHGNDTHARFRGSALERPFDFFEKIQKFFEAPETV